MSWDSDIASLLDDVLQDKEPEVVETPVQEATPTPPQAEEALSPEPEDAHALAVKDDEAVPITPHKDTTLADLLADDGPDFPDGTEEEGFIPPTIESRSEEVTTVVNEDVEKAALPAIDNSMFSEAVEEEHVPIPTFTDEELMEQIDIRNFGTLVSLTNRRWHAKIKDRKAAKDAAEASGADGESFEARKRLLVGADEKLRKVHSAIDAARTDHYAMTLPWSTVGVNDIGKRAGARLLPNSLFFEYVQKLGAHKVAMEEALEEFVQAYPTLIAISQQKLGSAFNQNEYPSPSSIEAHFDLSFDFDPIPSGSDFQGLQDAQVQKLAGALKRKTQQKIENAMQDAWKRVFDDVGHAAATLSNPDAMFHYTLFEKLGTHAAMLSHLNITDNKFMAGIADEIKKLGMNDAKEVRKDDAQRKHLGELAIDIHKRMKEYADEQPTAETN